MLSYFLKQSIIDIIEGFIEPHIQIIKYLAKGASGVVFSGILNRTTKVAIKFTYNRKECFIFRKISVLNLPIFIHLYACEKISLERMNQLIGDKADRANVDVYDTISGSADYKKGADVNMIVMEYIEPAKFIYTDRDIFQIYFNIVYALLHGVIPSDVNQYNIGVKRTPITLSVCDRKITLKRQLVLIDYEIYQIDRIEKSRLYNKLVSPEFEAYDMEYDPYLTKEAMKMIRYITDKSREYENAVTVLYNLAGMIDSDSSEHKSKLTLSING